MRVSELLQARSSGALSRSIEVSGYLIVSSLMAYLVEDERTAHSDQPHQGILISAEAIQPLAELTTNVWVGSTIMYAGEITLRGSVFYTGLGLLPLRMGMVYELRFIDNHLGCIHLQLAEPCQDVYLQIKGPVPAKTLPLIKHWFNSSLNAIQLKRLLESKAEHLILQYAEGETLTNAIATIESAGLSWRVEESTLGPGCI